MFQFQVARNIVVALIVPSRNIYVMLVLIVSGLAVMQLSEEQCSLSSEFDILLIYLEQCLVPSLHRVVRVSRTHSEPTGILGKIFLLRPRRRRQHMSNNHHRRKDWQQHLPSTWYSISTMVEEKTSRELNDTLHA